MYQIQKLYQKGWVSATYFVEKYNINDGSPYVYRDTVSKNYTKKIGKKELLINEKRLIELRNFYNRVWQEATHNYFVLIDGSNAHKLSRIIATYILEKKPTRGQIASWNDFIANDLFLNTFNERSLFSYRINKRLYQFWRITRWIIRRLKKRQDAIYKRLPNRDKYEEIYKERGCVRV